MICPIFIYTWLFMSYTSLVNTLIQQQYLIFVRLKVTFTKSQNIWWFYCHLYYRKLCNWNIFYCNPRLRQTICFPADSLYTKLFTGIFPGGVLKNPGKRKFALIFILFQAMRPILVPPVFLFSGVHSNLKKNSDCTCWPVNGK